jgi:hypothetical protein
MGMSAAVSIFIKRRDGVGNEETRKAVKLKR